MLLTQGLPLLPATIYYHKKRKLEWEFYFLPIQSVWSVPWHTQPPCSAVTKTSLPDGAWFQHQNILPTPPPWSEQLMKQLFLTKFGFCTWMKKVCNAFVWKVGEEGLDFVLEVLHPAPLLLLFQRLLQPPSFSCCCWVPFAFPTGNFTCQNYWSRALVSSVKPYITFLEENR